MSVTNEPNGPPAEEVKKPESPAGKEKVGVRERFKNLRSKITSSAERIKKSLEGMRQKNPEVDLKEEVAELNALEKQEEEVALRAQGDFRADSKDVGDINPTSEIKDLLDENGILKTIPREAYREHAIFLEEVYNPSKENFPKIARPGQDAKYDSLRFTEEPKPMPGVDYTQIHPYYAFLFGLTEEAFGRPDFLFDPKILGNFQEYQEYAEEVRRYIPDGAELKEALLVLSKLGVEGHSITNKTRARWENGLYNIARFGLWAGKNPLTDKYFSGPWTGQFVAENTHTNTSPTDLFDGFAVIFNPKTKPVEVPNLKTSFYSPDDLIFIVPNEAIKQKLIRAFDKDVTFDFQKLIYRTGKNIFQRTLTLKDLVHSENSPFYKDALEDRGIIDKSTPADL